MSFRPGQSVQWLMESRRGWGYRWWVPATVVKVGPRRVTIDAKLARGGTKRISVTPERLRDSTGHAVIVVEEGGQR